MQISDIKK